jgi:hypothetical protein
MKKIVISIVLIASAINLLAQPLTGTKTIGPSGDYPTFTAASADLLALGVGAGGVEFLVSPGIYNEAVEFFQVPGANAVNRIKFTAAGDSVFVVATGTTSSLDAAIRINGGDFYTFDGINTKNGGTSPSNFCESGYFFVNLGSFNNGCQGNIVKNCSIDMRFGSTVFNGSRGVRAQSSGTVTSLNGSFNNNKFQHLKIDGVESGLSLFGKVGFEGVNNEISNCTLGGGFGIKSQTIANQAIGILVNSLKNTKIFGNEIVSVSCATNVTSGVFGINVQLGNAAVFSNKINQVFQANPNVNGLSIGIRADATSLGESFVYNNFVSGVDNAATFFVNNNLNIIALHSAKLTSGAVLPNHWYNNTIVMTSATTKSVFTAGFALSDINGGHIANLKNNIIVNAMNGTGGISQHCIVDFNNTAPSGKLISNHNCLVASGTLGTIGRNATSPQQLVATTLAQWQANNPGLDINSVSLTPTFVSSTDFHLVSGSNPGIENGGIPLTQVIGDFDFQVRDAVAPDMGADEVLAVTLQESSVSIVSDMNPPIDCGTLVTFTATATDAGLTPQFDWRINGILVASNVNPFVTNQLNPNDEVHCEMISSLLSNSSLPISSNSIVVEVNPATLTTFFFDLDEDGFGRNDNIQLVCVQPLGFVNSGNDCDDFNTSINPNVPEICDEIDNNCDGDVDEGFTLVDLYEDNDGDGFGLSYYGQGCDDWNGYAIVDGDCNDNNSSINPAASEVCNNLDDDCNGLADDGLPFTEYFTDADADGYGSVSLGSFCSALLNCAGDYELHFYPIFDNIDDSGWNILDADNNIVASGYSYFGYNVIPLQLSNGPFTIEVYTGCIFGDNSPAFDLYYDGNIIASGSTSGCNGFYSVGNVCSVSIATQGGDCDDTDAAINPGATEVCDNGLDDDCDGVDNSCVTTQVQASQCGSVLPHVNTAVLAALIPGATQYRYKIQLGTLEFIVTKPSTSRWFYFPTDVPGFFPDTTYQISVSVELNGSFGSFGPICNVTLPSAVTQLQSSLCNSVLPSVYTPILASFIQGATQYRYKIVHGGNEFIVTKPSTSRWFYFPTDVPGFFPDSTYQISVSVELNGSFGPFGPICNVTLPSVITQLQSSLCNSVLPSVYTPILASFIQGATQYRYKIVHGGNELLVTKPSTSRWFYFPADVPGFFPDSTYQISVSVEFNGSFGPFGPVCNVTLPSVTTQLQSSLCNSELPSVNTPILAAFIQGATQYRYKIVHGGNELLVTKPSTSRWFYFPIDVPGFILGETYQISVSVEFNGNFGPFGQTCFVTLPITPAASPNNNNSSTAEEMETEAISGFDAVAFPNPFADAFTLNIRSESHEAVVVRVYDMNGKLLENRNLQVSEAATVVIGGNLAAGMYNVTVMQGDKLKTMKVIKTIR